MRYPFKCQTHGYFEVTRPINDTIPSEVACPECNEMSARIYEAPEAIVYKGRGFHSTDYFKQSQGRGQPMDKGEWLNSNWSKHYGEEPPEPSGKAE